ncbi:MAG: Asp-tRNA(Asn)/Glu-tRNA(Gln) amidotransferase subunit GatC [Candidatus Liptonbacteria bacterium]|nr:Asp-tRNA(Asn)/Glu-tRNA(Gln) amidotransferase subunit GatC [Candidatus Liptonbacteria bacterium]
MPEITKKEIKHLAELARLEISERDEEKLEHDLGEILNHFNELKEVDTENTKPLTGGTVLINSIRDDDPDPSFAAYSAEVSATKAGKALGGKASDTGKGKDQFPESDAGYLKVPSVFS